MDSGVEKKAEYERMVQVKEVGMRSGGSTDYRKIPYFQPGSFLHLL